MTGERYRIPVFELEALPHQGAAARLTRMEAKPATMRGHLIGQAVWQDSQAQAASQGTAAVIWPASWTQRPA